jgi:hypothetical protein
LETEKDKARYIKFNTASIETGFGFNHVKGQAAVFMKFSPTLPHTEALRAMLDAYGEGMLVL